MKIVKWDRYSNNSYPDLEDTSTKEEICEAWDVLVEEIRKNGYVFNGTYHQQGAYGAPVYDNGKMYRLSFREWGQVMLEAHPLEVDTYSELAWGDINKPGFKYPVADESDFPKIAMVMQPICGKTYKEIAETMARSVKTLTGLGYDCAMPIINNRWAEKRGIKDDTIIAGVTLHYLAEMLKKMSYCDIVYITRNDWADNEADVSFQILKAILKLFKIKTIYEDEIEIGKG